MSGAAWCFATVALALICDVTGYATGTCCDRKCFCDSQGSDDEGGGQKDLNKMCQLNVPSSTCPSNTMDKFQEVSWNWDAVDFSGANSHDACALFDTDSDGFANYALCVSLQGTKRTVDLATMLLYTCRDNSATRCFDAAVVGCQKVIGNYDPTKGECDGKPPLGSLLTVLNRLGSAEGDPYRCDGGGNKTVSHIKSSPGDTGCETTSAKKEAWDQIANICVNQKDLPLTARMIDVCSYPSVNPNSDSSDCVVFTSCANLQCPSLGCNRQVCSESLGRCVPTNGTSICVDNIACTTDVCQVYCDNTGCVFNDVPRDPIYGVSTPTAANIV
jgi:hypothetical protein